MAALVLRRGELLRKHPAGDGSPWQRCWMKMYSDRAVDHNNLKVFDVPSIQAVAKTSTSDTIVEFAVTTTGGTRLVFQAPSVQECDAWVRCITDAKRICLASNGRMLFQQAHNMSRSNAGTFTILHGYINLPNGSRMIMALPYDAAALNAMPVSACKRDILHKLKRKIDSDYPDLRLDTATSSVVCVEVRLIQSMPPPPLVVSIVSTLTKVSDLSQKEYTVRPFECNGLTWTVDRRYKQFYALHDDVLREAESPFKMYLPPLPPRRALTPKKGAFVAKRQQRLEAYLQDMVALPQLAQDVRVMVFLGRCCLSLFLSTMLMLWMCDVVVSTSRNAEMHPSDTRSVLHVSAVHTALEYGDVLLFKTRFGTSKVQRKKTRLLAYGREVTNAIVARRVLARRTPETLAKLQQFVLDVNGNKYSIVGILNRSKVDDKEKTSHYFCSELVAATLQHLGWLHTNVPPSYFWPGSFAQGGEVETDRHLTPSVALGPELAIDCKIMEVGRAQ
ncbi:hypothetical protein DYB25_005144 [Aphanomyces astaci]|uniref:PX domain-containing protein n=1 Tax=Aphanomyces astaci TaxID=112090 RepID=A0A397C8T5_APHAT|nr:hypothetical protein DYB25_005144 [Aphanomyces astaci]